MYKTIRPRVKKYIALHEMYKSYRSQAIFERLKKLFAAFGSLLKFYFTRKRANSYFQGRN